MRRPFGYALRRRLYSDRRWRSYLLELAEDGRISDPEPVTSSSSWRDVFEPPPRWRSPVEEAAELTSTDPGLYYAAGARPNGILTVPTALTENDRRQIARRWRKLHARGPSKDELVAELRLTLDEIGRIDDAFRDGHAGRAQASRRDGLHRRAEELVVLLSDP